MNTRTKTMIATGAVILGGAGVFGGTAVANAATSTTGGDLASAIATKFGLKQADVQTVIDAQRSKIDSERSAKATERLTQAVTDGKITAAQKDLIVKKQAELKAAREKSRDASTELTDTERKAAMEKERTDLKAWATTNNIPMEYLMGGGHGKPGIMGDHKPEATQ